VGKVAQKVCLFIQFVAVATHAVARGDFVVRLSRVTKLQDAIVVTLILRSVGRLADPD